MIATELESVVIKFAGDSGDGMQLAGSLFTDARAIFGNQIATFPDFPKLSRPFPNFAKISRTLGGGDRGGGGRS